VAERRQQLGRELTLGRRTYVFLTADAVEMDEVEGGDVFRSRVLLDDVTLVTLHRRPPWGFFWTGLLLLASFAAVMAIAPNFYVPGVLLVVVTVVTILSLFLVGGVHYVTVFGRRSRARMAWRLGGGRARQVFTLLVGRVTQRQSSGGAVAPPPP